ncbi:MAG: hypothetical protein IPI49_31030 [Myxococcales bacterium]|nr:hypothetical protein [Myxococcales bacterium]
MIAFYGFRGGAGRTTALAHFAAQLSARQVSPVAVDIDLEAPGLHYVLDCPESEEGRGVLALLRAASSLEDNSEQERSEALRLVPHIVKSRLDVGAPIRVLPAGRLSPEYLERLEDLGVPLWHIGEPPSPLEALIQQVKTELKPGAILLDCRTGLSGLSASAMFHVADVVVLCVPVSAQSLDGLEIVIKGVHAARAYRNGLPELLIVPTMVPEGPEGRERLERWFLPEIEERYAKVFDINDETALEPAERAPIVREGVEYRRGIALTDSLRTDFVQRSAGTYAALTRELDRLLKVDTIGGTVSVDARKIIEELTAHGNLKSLAFAESTPAQDIVSKFIQPADFRAITDPSTWYVIGAKGAGKTWMWQYLSSDVGQTVLSNVVFAEGHGPRSELLSPNFFRELEADKEVKLEKRQLHGAFWLLYAANRLLHRYEWLLGQLRSQKYTAQQARIISRLAAANDPASLKQALIDALSVEDAATFAERLIRAIDAALLQEAPTTILLYDGLDIGFGSDARSIARRRHFVSGLIEAIEPLRGMCKRIGFKLFLREDLFAEIDIQNQSHLDAATIELKWEPSDIWGLTLNVMWESPSYRACVVALDPSASPANWPDEEERRLRLLVPLWGDEMERGNKIQTARFIQRRTADGKDRLFPRTLVQLLAAAVEHQKTLESSGDRVLRAASILRGYNEASEKRVDDLRKEYVTLAGYLDALKGRNPTGTESEIIEGLKSALRLKKKSSTRSGVSLGALHARPRGWHKVIDRLLHVGVLREYKRARGVNLEKKYEIALLYRPGLGVKAFGV